MAPLRDEARGAPAEAGRRLAALFHRFAKARGRRGRKRQGEREPGRAVPDGASSPRAAFDAADTAGPAPTAVNR